MTAEASLTGECDATHSPISPKVFIDFLNKDFGREKWIVLYSVPLSEGLELNRGGSACFLRKLHVETGAVLVFCHATLRGSRGGYEIRAVLLLFAGLR